MWITSERFSSESRLRITAGHQTAPRKATQQETYSSSLMLFNPKTNHAHPDDQRNDGC
jgi:hypothetical protein